MANRSSLVPSQNDDRSVIILRKTSREAGSSQRSVFDDNHQLDPQSDTHGDIGKDMEEYEKQFKKIAKPHILSLYEDDHGKVDTVTEALKKTMVQVNIKNKETKNHANLGTLLGVFLPCCQNIVGIIYFVRFTWIVGSAGILEGALIVFICNLMSFCTAISMSAIATNGKVTAGGTYFMISRSLGPAFGGSVGFLFFMGTSISVAMYYLGTVEILLTYVRPDLAFFSDKANDPARYNDYRLFGTILLSCMTFVTFIGVKVVSKVAFCAILFLITALCSIYAGIILASPERSVKVCALGDRLIRHSIVFINNTWHCYKNESGPLFKAYCIEENDTSLCAPYFLENEARLIPGIPGLSLALLKENLNPAYSRAGNVPGTDFQALEKTEIVTDITTSFFILLAIYFPSITGVESGSNYSGELRDAQIAIPKGTMAAVIVTSSLYLGSVLFFGSTFKGQLLRDKYGESMEHVGDMVLSRVAWPSKWVVLIGTLCASIGAGMQALCGGPRLLQAIAEDNIIPHLKFFAQKFHGEPIRCLIATFIIAELGIIIAFLDYVAPIVTMFFLMCYGFINFAVTLQSLLGTPHWRPSFHFYHWSLTMFGTALCLVTMFICSWVYALIAITLATLLYNYIQFKGAEKEWGDGITGLYMTTALSALIRMKQDYHHIKNWRPQILVMLKMIDMQEGQKMFYKDDHDLVMLGEMLKEGKGLTMYATVIKGHLFDKMEEKDRMKQIYMTCLETSGVKGFVEVIIAPSIIDGLSCMVQSAGLGALRPNTIIMGWPTNWTSRRDVLSLHIFLETMRNVALARNAVIVVKAKHFPSKSSKMIGNIDIWWIVNDGGMLLLLGHLLRRHKTWNKCHLRLFTVAMSTDNAIQMKEDLEIYLYQLRIEGTVEVVELAGEDMSAFLSERPQLLEERARLSNLLNTKQQNRMSKDLQHVVDRSRSAINKTPDGSSSIDYRFKDPLDLHSTEEMFSHLNTAGRLNEVMRSKSSEASLVILNLPCVPESAKGRATYMSFIETMTEGFDRLLLVRGTGMEVITVYN